MSLSINKKSNEKINNFINSPLNNSIKTGTKKETPEKPKILSSNEQLTKYFFHNIQIKNKNSSNSQSVKDRQKINESPNEQFYYKSKIQKETYANLNKNFNDTKSSDFNRSPISLTGRITNLHNIKANKDKNEDEKKKYKGSNVNLNFKQNQKAKIDNNTVNMLIKSSNLIGHNSKSVNSNNKNIKIGNNLIIKTVNEGVNNLRKENIYGNKNNYNFSNNNHGIINNMNNNTSKNKKKSEVSNSSNLNLGMLSFSTSNISNNLISTTNTSNSKNIIKNSKIKDNNDIQSEQNKNNLNLCLENISNSNNAHNEVDEKISKLITNNDNNNNKDIQTKSAEQTTRNPKFFNNESVYNTNYIINVIDSNEAKNVGFCGNNKENNNNQACILGQIENKKKNYNNNAYKELTNITKNNVNEILSKRNVKIPNSHEDINKEEKKNDCNYTKYTELSNRIKYKNPEELHFSMIKISQNINRLKTKF